MYVEHFYSVGVLLKILAACVVYMKFDVGTLCIVARTGVPRYIQNEYLFVDYVYFLYKNIILLCLERKAMNKLIRFLIYSSFQR